MIDGFPSQQDKQLLSGAEYDVFEGVLRGDMAHGWWLIVRGARRKALRTRMMVHGSWLMG